MNKITVLLLAMTASLHAFAQEGAEEKWTATAGVTGIINTGNAENTTIGGNAIVSYQQDENLLTFNADGAYGRAEVNGTKETNTKNWTIQLRYDRFLAEHVSIYGLTRVNQNKPSGFDLRYGGATGLSLYIIRNDDTTLKAEAGYDYSREERIGTPDASIHSARFYAQFTRKVNENVFFGQDVEALFNLEDSDDVRMNTLTSLNVALSEDTSLALSYIVRWDNQPVAGFEEVDTTTQIGLNVNFL
jgi:putative salt-induced outer membrane protein YdiY